MKIIEIIKEKDGIEYHLTVEEETNKVLKMSHIPPKVVTGNKRVDELTVEMHRTPMNKLEEKRFLELFLKLL